MLLRITLWDPTISDSWSANLVAPQSSICTPKAADSYVRAAKCTFLRGVQPTPPQGNDRQCPGAILYLCQGIAS